MDRNWHCLSEGLRMLVKKLLCCLLYVLLSFSFQYFKNGARLKCKNIKYSENTTTTNI